MILVDIFVIIIQLLGGIFIVVVNGNFVCIEGYDVDVFGKQLLESSFEILKDGSVNENQVWEVLCNCYDLEILVNVVDFGLIYECMINNGFEDGNYVYIKMILIVVGCGMGLVICEDVQCKVEYVFNVDKVMVDLIFDLFWSNDMFIDEVKFELGML